MNYIPVLFVYYLINSDELHFYIKIIVYLYNLLSLNPIIISRIKLTFDILYNRINN